MAAARESGCPACQARFRGTRECSRCGADLGVLMRLQVRAWRLRERAREALIAGDAGQAVQWARRAQELCATPRGRKLERVARILLEAGGRRVGPGA